jgi:hypothetical protein
MRWENQRRTQKRNIATGFRYEIKEIQKIIKPLLEYYEEAKQTEGRTVPTSILLLHQAIKEKNINLSKNISLYNENGLYYHFRKEIYLFDTNVVESILNFYRNLLQADKEYKIYEIGFQEHVVEHKIPQHDISKAQFDFFDHSKEIDEEASRLIKMFEGYINS